MAQRQRNMARDRSIGWPAKFVSFRRNLQQHAGTGASRQEKTPTENGWGFVIGGGGGNRTPVRKFSTASSTYLALPFDLTRKPPTGRLVASDPLDFRAGPRGEELPYFLLFMTLLLVTQPDPQADRCSVRP